MMIIGMSMKYDNSICYTNNYFFFLSLNIENIVENSSVTHSFSISHLISDLRFIILKTQINKPET